LWHEPVRVKGYISNLDLRGGEIMSMYSKYLDEIAEQNTEDRKRLLKLRNEVKEAIKSYLEDYNFSIGLSKDNCQEMSCDLTNIIFNMLNLTKE